MTSPCTSPKDDIERTSEELESILGCAAGKGAQDASPGVGNLGNEKWQSLLAVSLVELQTLVEKA
jgi:hypothetical protein